MAIKQKCDPHPLKDYYERKDFVPYHLDMKCCVTLRDAEANPKTAVELSILIFETHGDRFTV
eukprot:5621964-Pleurochrysis_carterae.AAC.1